jgi:hypothetical protein
MTTDANAQLLWRARVEQRQDREWAARTTNERMQIAKLQEQADTVFQASGQMMPAPRAEDSVDGYRVRMLQALCPSTHIPRGLAGDPETLERFETGIAQQILDRAHQLPVLRPIFRKGPDGRIATEFIGQKNSWMAAYKAPVMTGAILIDGEPATF